MRKEGSKKLGDLSSTEAASGEQGCEHGAPEHKPRTLHCYTLSLQKQVSSTVLNNGL